MNRNNSVNWGRAKAHFIATDIPLSQMAEIFSSSGRSMRRHCLDEEWLELRAERQLRKLEKEDLADKIELDTRQDSMAVTVKSETIQTLEGALKAAQVDLTEWEVDRHVINSWQVTARNRDVDLTYTEGVIDGHVVETPGMIQRTNWQVKVWLKRKTLNIEKALDAVEAAFAEIAIPPDVGRKIELGGPGRGLIEISMPDIHLGKLSWDEETGHGDGDLVLILKAVKQIIVKLTEKAARCCPERILLIVGNDLLHVDNLDGTTTKGTPMDVDGRPQKLFEAAIAINMMAIRLLKKIAPVDILILPGNHDANSILHLGSALKGYCSTYEDVTIDNKPRSRKYYRHGSVLLGFCHGDKDDPKLSDLPLLLMRENQSIINEIKWMEWHVGHLHKRKEMSWLSLESDNGIQVRHLPALCVPDSWHARHGFVGQPRAADMYMWDKDKGYQGHLTHNYEVKDGETAV